VTVRHVLVTGTSRGIGQATAFRLASAGMSVLARVRDPEDSTELERRGRGRVIPIILDICRDDSIECAADRVRWIVGVDGLSALVNNAAATGPGSPMECVTRDALERTFGVTTCGTFLLIHALLPMIRQAGGRIVTSRHGGGGPAPVGSGAARESESSD
jgi:NAD(P)-dependent dehydrogenase (short-subunit alcohol dehydrogenase family)